ncbi:MAG: flagellar motor switch protein FliN [Caedibacter sp. 37-49]|nr:MAG: flagellar motor switch protein FliN [Caedibacter sp. 37-49]
MSSSNQRKISIENDFTSNSEFKPLNDVFVKSSSEAEASSQPLANLKALYDVPLQISAVLGRAQIPIKQLLNIVPGSVIELDRKIGEPIEIYLNNQLLARGNVVLIEDRLGITITEIIKIERS